VTNPDHIAVALRYSPRTHAAPTVLWKATDEDAEKVKAAARQQGIAVMRNVPLAHALLDVDVGQDVPEAVTSSTRWRSRPASPEQPSAFDSGALPPAIL
jgi:flagellar biosynthesis protein FlhB